MLAPRHTESTKPTPFKKLKKPYLYTASYTGTIVVATKSISLPPVKLLVAIGLFLLSRTTRIRKVVS
jgi:hypothetical protein